MHLIINSRVPGVQYCISVRGLILLILLYQTTKKHQQQQQKQYLLLLLFSIPGIIPAGWQVL